MSETLASEIILLVAIAVRTAIIFVVLIVGIRLSGKRQTGEMNLHDLLVVLIVANSVQNGMTQGSEKLAVAIVSSGTLILLGGLYNRAVASHPSWQKLLSGVPTVIVEDGRMITRRMRREGVTEQELMMAVRDEGLENLARVKLAVLEADGTIAVVPAESPSTS